MSAILVALLWSSASVHADPSYVFSGTLTDQNSAPLAGVTVSLTDASSNTTSATTASDGSFNVAAAPSTYYLTLSATNLSGMNFTVRQSSSTPSIDLTTAGVTQNLTLPLATVSFTAYTAQGALNPNNPVTASSDSAPGTSVSLYPGDPGETYVQVANATAVTANAQGTGSFTSIIGAKYTGGICDKDGSNVQIGCNVTPLTVTSGANSVNVPQAPNTFSGALKDQNGNSLVGVALSLSDGNGHTASTTTAAGGAFSLSVVPGMYYISDMSATNVNGLYLVGMQQTGTPSINLTAGNVTQNLTLPIAVVNYTAYTATGQPNTTGTVTAGSAYNAASLVSLYPGDPGEWISVNAGLLHPGSQGTGSFKTVIGVVYSPGTICEFDAAHTLIACNTTSYTVANSVNTIALPNPLAPTLSVSTPSTTPSLSWTSVSTAATYNVYRDGVKITSTSSTSFLDNNVPGGSRAYYVTAVDTFGQESGPSNTVNATVVITAPTLSTPSFSANPVIKGQTTTVTVQVQGNLYGFLSGEYYIGSTDPGQGNGTAMTYSNGVLTAVLSTPNTGNFTINIRARNGAGWSTPISASYSVVLPVFSGTLTNSSGTGLVGVSLSIKNSSGTTTSTTTTTGGAFSLTVQPGMYYISNVSGSNIDGIYSFVLAQASANPSINLVTGNVTLNMVLPVTTVNFTTYNAQGYQAGYYVRAQTNSGSATPIALYAGDPGMMVTNITTTQANFSTGSGSFKTLVGVTYAGSGHTNGICNYATSSTNTPIGCTPSYTIVSGVNTVSIPNVPAPRNTYSGTLTNSSGTGLVGVTITLRDAYGNQVTTTTTTGGNFSLSVQPGMYALTVTSSGTPNIEGLGYFLLQQSSTSPSINLTAGNVTQNLVLPTVTINANLYNAQGYVNANGRLNSSNASGTAILYAGDPGFAITLSSLTANAGGSGVTSIKSIVGTTYTNGLCSWSQSSSPTVNHGCLATYTVVSGANNVVIPQAPASPNVFSGILTDGDGAPLQGITVALQDGYGNIVPATTASDGSFSVSVQPGMYGLKLSGTGTPSATSIGAFTAQQFMTAIDLTAGNATQNLVLPTTTMNVTLYNTQGYLNGGGKLRVVGGTGNITLYSGDPGMMVVINDATFTANSSGVVVFKTIAGVTYSGTPGSSPASENGLTLGPDGAIWFGQNSSVGSVTTTASFDAYTLSQPYINAGRTTVADGALWYVESVSQNPNKYIGRITTSGVITNYYVGYSIDYITTGSDGNIWFNSSSCSIGRLNVSTGAVSCFGGTESPMRPMISGPDGNIYYYYGSIADNKFRLYKRNPSTGATTLVYTFPTYANPTSIAVGPDGKLYLTDQYNGYVWAITTSGSATSYNVGSYIYGNPNSIVSGPDGNLWFAKSGGIIAKMTTSGVKTEYRMAGGLDASALAVGSDGNIWFKSWLSRPVIGRITTDGVITLYAMPGDVGNGLCSYNSANTTSYGCITYTAVAGTNNVDVPNTPAPRNTFSGTLKDQNGNAIVGITVKLTDAYSNNVSAVTASDGSFSIDVQPGMHSLSLSLSSSGGTNGFHSFTMGQTGAPTIDLTADDVTRNLVLAVATINYADTGSNGSMKFTGSVPGTVSLYAGDPGMTVSSLPTITKSVPSSGGLYGNFKAIVGTVYASGTSMCHNTTCLAGSLTVGTGPYYVSILNVQTPSNFNVATPTTLPSLSWNAVTTGVASGYIVYRDSTAIATVTGTSYIDSNVSSGAHTYYIRATDSTGNLSGQSSSKNVTVNAAVPTVGTPSLSVNPVVAGQNTTVTVQVTGNLYGMTGGEYFIGTDPGQGNGTAMSYSNGTLTATITASTLGDQTVKVRAHNATGWSSLANVTLSILPPAPTGLAATSPTTEPSLSWDAVSGVGSYKVYRDSTLLATVSTNSFVDSNVAPGTHTYYVVAVADATHVSSPSSTINVTVTTATPTVGTPSLSASTVTAGENSTVTAQVTGNMYGFLGGEYYVGSTDPGEGSGTAMTYGSGELSAVISGLAPGTHTINVRAQNGAGWSTPVSVTLHVLPLAPTDLAASSPTMEPSLSWTAVSGATSYDVYRDDVKIDSTTDTTYVDTTAAPGTYTYYVIAVAGVEESDASDEVEVVVEGVSDVVAYYTTDDGTTFSKTDTAVTSGVSTHTNNSDGSVTVSVDSATGYAESGFTTWTGTLGSLSDFTITGTGDEFSLSIWFDTDEDDSFFEWDNNGARIGLAGDTYGTSADSTDGTLTVTGSTSFYMADASQSYTLAELIAGDDTVSGIDANTVVTIWIGVKVSSDSASATITSTGALI